MSEKQVDMIASLVPLNNGVAACEISGGVPTWGEEHSISSPVHQTEWFKTSWTDDVSSAVNAALRSRDSWGATSSRERASSLREIAGNLREHVAEFADLIVLETGKLWFEAKAEVLFSADYFEWFADAASMITDQHLLTGNRRFVVQRIPVGIVAAITPWNFPLSIPARKIAAALAAGCPVVLKPSEMTPLSGLALTQLAQASLPEGVLNVVVGDGEQITNALIDHSSIAAITFTGSSRVGALIAQRAMATMTRVTMELGGRAPFIIREDADPVAAVDTLMIAKFRNNGASCIAANNVFVHADIYEEVLKDLAGRISNLEVGDPFQESSELGPMLRQQHVDRLRSLVSEATAKGCRSWVAPVPSGGWYCPPTLIEALDDHQVWNEEVFGPLCVMRPYRDEEALLEEVNSWELGLAGYVFSSDTEAALTLGGRLRVGIVGINNGAPNSPMVPFGGFRFSGLGREGGVEGVLEFTESQTISLSR